MLKKSFFSGGNIWNKVFKNGLSKICGSQPLKNLNGYGLPSSTNFTWSILEYFVPFNGTQNISKK